MKGRRQSKTGKMKNKRVKGVAIPPTGGGGMVGGTKNGFSQIVFHYAG
jgi:hypothetical protein